MSRAQIKASMLLLVTAFIWGTAFVAQRAGMESLGPFAFNGIRFLVGAAIVLPFALMRRNRTPANPLLPRRKVLWIVAAGVVLFAGSMLQQAGLVTTTAGKAGFITGLYIVFVPLIGIATGTRLQAGEKASVIISTAGLYLLSVTGALVIERGDFMVLGGAVLWAVHVVIIGKVSPRVETFGLAFGQFFVNGVLSLGCAFALESFDLAAVRAAALPIAYGGILSVGIAYTIQVAAQKNAPPTLAVIIMSLEAVFAALAGWAMLGETMTPRMLAGGALMLLGMIVAQVRRR